QVNHTVRCLRPYEAAAFQALGVQVHAVAAPPQQLHQVAATPSEHEHVARERALAERRLHNRSQPVHALPHVGHTSGDPHARARRQRDHRNSSIALCNAARSAAPRTRIRPPVSSTSMTPLRTATGPARLGRLASIVTGSIVVVPVAGARQTAGRWRLTIHLRTRFALMPCDIATDATDASPARHSSTTACLKRSSNPRLPSRPIPI